MQGLRGKRWLVALLWCLGSSMSQAQSVYQGQLANGLKVLVQTDRRAPVVVSQIWYRVGSADEEEVTGDRKSTRLNSSHLKLSRMPSSA